MKGSEGSDLGVRARLGLLIGGATLPLFAYFVYTTWWNPISPFFANYDPEFQYLLNSLEVFKGRPYYYADHPGSPLEVIGSLIYALTLPFFRGDLNEFVRFHLIHPRIFLTAAHGSLVLGSALTIRHITRIHARGRSVDSAVFGAALGLMYFAVHPMAFESLMLWSHNSVSFALGTLLLVMLYEVLRTVPRGQRVRHQRMAFLGFGAGVLASVTIYLAAWVIGCMTIVAIWCALSGVQRGEAWRSIVVFAVASVLGFVAGVIPVMHRLSAFSDWILALVTHESPYLLADPGQPLLQQWMGSLLRLTQELPVLFAVGVVLTVMAAIAFLRWGQTRREEPASWAVILGLSLQSMVLTMFIVDHPKPDYMLAVAAVQPVLAMAILNIFLQSSSAGPWLRAAFSFLVFVGVVMGVLTSVARHDERALLSTRVEQETSRLQRVYAEQQGRGQQSLVVVWTYGTYSPCFSWWFGNDSTDNAFRREIGRLCPRDLALDYFGQMVIPRQGARPLSDTGWDIIFGCAEAFKIPALRDLPYVVSYPDLPLSCGALTVAHRYPP